jgi:hypothetical protein
MMGKIDKQQLTEIIFDESVLWAHENYTTEDGQLPTAKAVGLEEK